MGWSFNWVDHGRKAHIEDLTSAKHFSEGYVPLEYRVVGNNVWQLVQRPNGDRFICLDLIAKERNGGWGHKGLSEDMGPCEVNCPLSLLNKASPITAGYAVEWRQKVREYHAKKAAHKAIIKAGAVVRCGQHTYKLIEPYAPRKGWKVLQIESGIFYRMPSKQLARAEAV